jgi:flagellar basal-body rod modification protein FlgD
MSTVTTTGATSTTINDLMATMNAKSTSSSSSSTSGTGTVQADTDKFMTLLVAQLQNQDPLNPMDNAQVTSQLAQLQTVTGINNLNDTLNSLKSSYQSSESMQATNLIGRGVLVEGTDVALSSSKGVLGVELGTDADDVKVVISDKSGNQVETMDLGAQKAGVLPLAWNGVPDATQVDSSGNPVTLADGNYTFKVVATSGGQTLTDAKGLTYSSVASVTTGGTDGVKLNLPNKGAVALSDIKQVL